MRRLGQSSFVLVFSQSFSNCLAQFQETTQTLLTRDLERAHVAITFMCCTCMHNTNGLKGRIRSSASTYKLFNNTAMLELEVRMQEYTFTTCSTQEREIIKQQLTD